MFLDGGRRGAPLSEVGGATGVFLCSMKHYWTVCMECAEIAMGQDDVVCTDAS